MLGETFRSDGFEGWSSLAWPGNFASQGQTTCQSRPRVDAAAFPARPIIYEGGTLGTSRAASPSRSCSGRRPRGRRWPTQRSIGSRRWPAPISCCAGEPRESAALLRVLTGHHGWVNSVAMSGDGRHIVSGSERQDGGGVGPRDRRSAARTHWAPR